MDKRLISLLYTSKRLQSTWIVGRSCSPGLNQSSTHHPSRFSSRTPENTAADTWSTKFKFQILIGNKNVSFPLVCPNERLSKCVVLNLPNVSHVHTQKKVTNQFPSFRTLLFRSANAVLASCGTLMKMSSQWVNLPVARTHARSDTKTNVLHSFSNALVLYCPAYTKLFVFQTRTCPKKCSNIPAGNWCKVEHIYHS